MNYTKVNVEKISAKSKLKEERQKFLYGQAVSGIMKELNCSWNEAKKQLKFRMVQSRIAREMSNIN